MKKKDYFINSVWMIDIDGSLCIPTILLYKSKNDVLIGYQADAEKNNRSDINEDFKIDLGEIDTKSKDIEHFKKFKTASKDMVAATKLTNDFLYELLKYSNNWMAANDITGDTNVMLAEPLAMQTDIVPSDWLIKYRDNLRRILKGKLLGNHRIDNVDFLPEPFAVFQYYRYGYKHPLVAERVKNNVLVIDFGGGTFDVCIIETTSKGDISQTGRNSKPLAASSDPIGGYFINKKIAKLLIKKYFPKKKEAIIKKGIGAYEDWRRNKISFTTIKEEYQNYINNFHELIYRIEGPKIAICRSINDWRLDAPLNQTAPVNIPEDPFQSETKMVNMQLSASDIRQVFIHEIWEQNLKQIIHRAVKRGKAELEGAPISIVLLSGGSSNIGWLKELFKRDFTDELEFAEILTLKDFQEVVAKGLAVECARRYYNEGEGDFSSVTYNRLCLILDPDSKGYNLKHYKPIIKELPDTHGIPGVLLPSASIIRKFINKPMRWKVRLDKSPKNKLDYYFLRSSFDPNDLDNLQNIEEKTIYTPSYVKSFDSQFKIELNVKEDGTAIPKFIYKSGRFEEEPLSRDGRPFYLDMTSSQFSPTVKAYIGLDFGTSYTSISYIDEFSINSYIKRAGEKSWTDLNDLQSVLPYPLSSPLLLYLSESNPIRLIDRAFDFIEAALAIAGFISYIDYCIKKRTRKTKLFKSFTQRSAGPLWGFFEACSKKIKNHETVSAPYRELLNFKEFIDDTIKLYAQYKHKKVDESAIDHFRLIRILANISQTVFANWTFGYFENVEKKKFGKEYTGVFRHATGQAPFIKTSVYKGLIPFSKDQAVLININNDIALPLQPLIFWESCQRHPDLFTDHCFIFDKEEKGNVFSFKAIGYPCSCEVSLTNEYNSLAEELKRYKEGDPKIEFLKPIKLYEIKT